MTFLGVLALVVGILAAWLCAAIVLALFLGRVLGWGPDRPWRASRRDFDRAA
ncbi:hypothetical protein [Naasia aerilata]|uniref:Uncharacterized protein n=1 Tax=Naasia aerilata TaxID=1162966 RepID=A0ABN6XM40_9MICO|nr:hypothetical protein [Naasia aerilata]BDZ45954.1 hypothetical protein GCM10025866_18630 [Naasia aerilata]